MLWQIDNSMVDFKLKHGKSPDMIMFDSKESAEKLGKFYRNRMLVTHGALKTNQFILYKKGGKYYDT